MNITHNYNYSGESVARAATIVCRFCERANPTRFCIACKQPVHNSDLCGVVVRGERRCHICELRHTKGGKRHRSSMQLRSFAYSTCSYC